MSLHFDHYKGDKNKPPAWLRHALLDNLACVEERVGSRIVRVRPGYIREPIGCGTYGCVFSLEDDRKVLKISHDRYEGSYSLYVKSLQDNGIHTPSGPVLAVTARIHDVFTMGEHKRKPIFGIVVERVEPCGCVPIELKRAVNHYVDGWDLLCEANAERDRPSGKKIAKATRMVDEGLVRIDESGPAGRAVGDFLRLTKEDGHPLTDVHEANLCARIFDGPGGAEAGQVVIIDFGGSATCSALSRAAVDRRLSDERSAGKKTGSRRVSGSRLATL